MRRAQRRLAQCADSIFKRSSNQRAASLNGLMNIAGILGKMMMLTCLRYSPTREATLKESLVEAASSMTFVNECISLFRRAVETQAFGEAHRELYCWSITSVLAVVEAYNFVYDRALGITAPPEFFSDLAPLERQKILGIEAALSTMKLCIEAIQSLPRGILYHEFSLNGCRTFSRAWASLVSNNVALRKGPRPIMNLFTMLGRLETSGMSVFVDCFGKLAANYAIVHEGNMNTAFSTPGSAAAGDCSFDETAVQSFLQATGTWGNMCRARFYNPSDASYPMRDVGIFLASPEMQEKTLEAATTLLKGSQFTIELSAVSGENWHKMNFNAMALLAQAAAFSIRVQSSRAPSEGGAGSSSSVTPLEAAQWLTPASQSMKALVQAYSDPDFIKEYHNAAFTWDALNIASQGLLINSLSVLKNTVSPSDSHSDGKKSPIYTTTDILAILDCATNLFELDIALAGLLEAAPEAWARETTDKLILVPAVPQLVATRLLAFLTYEATWDSELELRPAAVAAVEAGIKNKLVLSKLPSRALQKINDACARATPPIRETIWLDFLDTSTTILYNILSKVLHLDSFNCSEEVALLTGAGALLGILHAYSCFEKRLAPRFGNAYPARFDASLLLTELHVGDDKCSVLLPEDVPALHALKRQILYCEQTQINGMFENMGGKEYSDFEFDESHSGGVMFALQLLINTAECKYGLQQRRVRRAKALATRRCCNIECRSIAKNGKKLPRLRCAGCGAQHYCSVECQKKAWKEHKMVCKEL